MDRLFKPGDFVVVVADSPRKGELGWIKKYNTYDSYLTHVTMLNPNAFHLWFQRELKRTHIQIILEM